MRAEDFLIPPGEGLGEVMGDGYGFRPRPMDIEDIVAQLRFQGLLPYSGMVGERTHIVKPARRLRTHRRFKQLSEAVTVGRSLSNDEALSHRANTRQWMMDTIQRNPDLLNDAFFSTNAMFFGAIPLEDDGFRHALELDGTAICYDCKQPSAFKDVRKSVLDRGTNVGGGQVIVAPILWCEDCGDREPPDEGRYFTYVGYSRFTSPRNYVSIWNL
jgi:hypothetical protein